MTSKDHYYLRQQFLAAILIAKKSNQKQQYLASQILAIKFTRDSVNCQQLPRRMIEAKRHYY